MRMVVAVMVMAMVMSVKTTILGYYDHAFVYGGSTEVQREMKRAG